MAETKKTPRPPNDRGQGRKPTLQPDQRAVVGSIRLTAEEWAKLRALGVPWLRARLRTAKVQTSAPLQEAA